MTALPRRRRRYTFIALAAGLVSAIVAPTLVFVGAKAISNSKAGKNALANVTPEQTFPQTPTAMLATVSAANELTSVTVFVLAPDSDVTAAGYDQRGGSVVSVPINIDTGSGQQLLSLHDAYALGGEPELRLDLEAAINLTVDFSSVMTGDQLAEFLKALPAVQVTLPRDVLGADGAVMFPKGPIALTPTQVAQIMTTRSQTEREHLRQQNLDAVWAAFVSAVGTGLDGQTLSTTAPTNFAEVTGRLMAGPLASRGLLARPLPAQLNPEGLDIESLDRPDAIMVFASIAPAQMSRPASGLSYRVEAPPGYDQQVRKTIGILLALGGNVVSVDLNSKPTAETTFFIYDAGLAAIEPKDNRLFGTIKIATPDKRLGGIDETLALGTDYLKKVDLSAPDATSTSTTTSIPPTETTG
ncbi:MAG: hypothetical protein QOE09_3556 [Ilumatobacteraceae bacterium]